MRPSYAADMLSEMYTDNAVDLLNTLDKKQIAKYLSLMSADDASEIKELLHYEDETAGAIMTSNRLFQQHLLHSSAHTSQSERFDLLRSKQIQ